MEGAKSKAHKPASGVLIRVVDKIARLNCLVPGLEGSRRSRNKIRGDAAIGVNYKHTVIAELDKMAKRIVEGMPLTSIVWIMSLENEGSRRKRNLRGPVRTVVRYNKDLDLGSISRRFSVEQALDT